MEISVGKDGSTDPFMKHSWQCWSSIKHVAFATWHNKTASYKFQGNCFDISGYNYNYNDIIEGAEGKINFKLDLYFLAI